jgi:CheY-like chemotaxis protein
VDDSPDFLSSLDLIFSKQFNVKLFSDAQLALDYVNTRRSAALAFGGKRSLDLSGDSEKWVKQVLNHPNLKRFDQERAMDISVLVVDYAMPNMNGIELCSKINNPAIKKILLTGHATPGDAVAAFNDNTIHYYISKSDENMIERLSDAINRLQHAYFQDLSSSIKTDAVDMNTPFFADTKLAEYFQSICTSLDTKEYFYLTNPSRFALKTRDDSQFLCLIYTEEDINEHVKIMEEEDAPEDLINSIASHEFIPLFASEDGYYEPERLGSEMQIYPAQKVVGNTNYYCAVISQPEALPQPTKNAYTIVYNNGNVH